MKSKRELAREIASLGAWVGRLDDRVQRLENEEALNKAHKEAVKKAAAKKAAPARKATK